MENSLLIGNGLNQCLEGGVPWGNLLKMIADKYGVDYNPENQMPLEFERILNSFLEKIGKIDKKDMSDVYDSTKKQIVQMVEKSELPEKAIHREVPFELFDNVLTTNYDMLLEKALIVDIPKEENLSKSYKYILQRTSNTEHIDFFHPHGIVKVPGSICLGYEHYMGQVEQLRKQYNGKKNGTKGLEKTSVTEKPEMRIYRILTGIDKPTNEWGEKFYTSNVAIIGLGLTECESDLWWLLTHRASIYYSNYRDVRQYLTNRIIFFDVINDIEQHDLEKEKYRIQSEKLKMNRHDMLKHLHVQVEAFKLSEYDGSYEEIYREIFGRLKRGTV